MPDKRDKKSHGFFLFLMNFKFDLATLKEPIHPVIVYLAIHRLFQGSLSRNSTKDWWTYYESRLSQTWVNWGETNLLRHDITLNRPSSAPLRPCSVLIRAWFTSVKSIAKKIFCGYKGPSPEFLFEILLFASKTSIFLDICYVK